MCFFKMGFRIKKKGKCPEWYHSDIPRKTWKGVPGVSVLRYAGKYLVAPVAYRTCDQRETSFLVLCRSS